MDQYNAELRAEIASVHKNVFDTFSRTLRFRFHMQSKEVVVEDPNYMSDFDSLDSVNNNNTKYETYQDFPACVIYLPRQEFADFTKGDDSNVRYNAQMQRIRVQVEMNAWEFLRDAVRFSFDGELYATELGWSRMGPVSDFQFYELTLQSVV